MASILIVEDEPTIRNILLFLLEEERHMCRAVASAEEALALLSAGAFDLVMTDMSLPKMSGAELLRRIRQYYPKIPVIMVSGRSDYLTGKEVLELGAYAFIAKPYALATIADCVSQAIDQANTAPKKKAAVQAA